MILVNEIFRNMEAEVKSDDAKDDWRPSPVAQKVSNQEECVDKIEEQIYYKGILKTHTWSDGSDSELFQVSPIDMHVSSQIMAHSIPWYFEYKHNIFEKFVLCQRKASAVWVWTFSRRPF